jgi:hypothetical protein
MSVILPSWLGSAPLHTAVSNSPARIVIVPEAVSITPEKVPPIWIPFKYRTIVGTFTESVDT